ncbi:autotransporter outer membrane beta-barrel domain-containing protein [Segnochrobactrum spirostomi]|uniref:autotransporter outer membrane beta-barrel domain-containing protein n=1 Tax=Segnochrobactrum spirostomi TaxID=2608987 RepID=UPI0028AEEA3B|nr:autotransporter domain-containing protein [Segnochrobactrum spirostomi]
MIVGQDGDEGASPDAGGGGGGSSFGDGGAGGAGALGGAGGTFDGAAGSDGADGDPGQTSGGGGGGSGRRGVSGTLSDVTAAHTGGAGGSGGHGGNGAGVGGGGGGGGGAPGAALTSALYSGRVTISADQTGGAGGAGGAGTGVAYGGNGGTGGAGIVLYSTVNTPMAGYVTISSTTTIAGGAGGAAGTSATSGHEGIAGNGGAGIEVAEGTGTYTLWVRGTVTGGAAGGAGASGGPGIVGANLSIAIFDGGTVSGGGGTTPGAAIQFTGGSNVLDLYAGATLVGNVVGAGAGDILELVGEGQATLNMSQVAGFGSYNMASSGTWTLNGPTSAATQWYFQTGILSISDFASLGSEASNLAFYGGTLAVTASSATAMPVSLETSGGTVQVVGTSTAATMAGVISGEGGLTKTGAGTLILLADNTYTGGTTISEGTLQLGNGGTTGSIVGNVVNNAALVINRSGTYDFPGTITGSGSVTIVGGTVNFTGEGGYSGQINVADASLVLSQGSTSASSFAIGPGGTISGTGTIGGLAVLEGGTASPGYSPGTLTVNGNVAFSPGSVYQVDITPAGAHDLITATGTATIGGGTVQVVATQGTYAPGTTYTILTAQGGVSGQFASVTANYAFLDPVLSYDANDVYLTVVRNTAAFPDVAYTVNQKAAAGAVESLGAGNAVYDAVLQLSASAAPAAFDALSGEIYASASSVMQQQSIYLREAVGTRVRQGLAGQSGGGQSTAKLAPGYDATVWAQGYGGWGQIASDGNAASLDSSIAGFLMGVDAAVASSARVGLVGGYSRSTLNVDARSSSGDIDNYDVGLYGGAQFGALSLLAAASYTWHDLSVDRTVAFSGFSGLNSADYKAGTAQVFGEAAWRVGLDKTLDPKTFGAASVTPFVDLAYVNLSSDNFTETGSAAALTGSADTENTFYSTLGVRAATTFQMANGAALTPHLSLGWQHAFGDVNANANLAFVGGGSAFSVSGVPIARDSALVGAGVEYAFSKTVSASLSYNGQFASGTEDNAFKGAISIKF